MRAPSLAVIVAVLFAATLVVAVVLGSRTPSAPVAREGAVAAASSVSGGGFALTSTSVEAPADDAVFPAGAGVELVNQRCLSCHSASMVLTQPPLKPEQWTAIVEKMRDVYHAPVAAGEVAPIVGYLAGRTAAAPNTGP